MQLAAPSPENLISLDEAARRIGLAKQTLKNWICAGKLAGDGGLCYLQGGRGCTGRTPMVDWPMFAAKFIRRAA